VIALLLALCEPAAALDARWWGVGPTIGTMAVPTKYPVSLPNLAQNEVEKVRGDVEVGAEAVLYPGKAGRVFAHGTIGFGTAGWLQPELVVGWDTVVLRDEELQVLWGAGLGAGAETFHSATDNDVLRVGYFPLRTQVSLLLRDKVRAYEASLWGTWHIAGSQELCTAGDTASCEPAKGDALVAGALYFGVGAEATLYFGDWKNKNKK
jgi:hypothetical protein